MSRYWFGEEKDVDALTKLLSAVYEKQYDRDYVEWITCRGRWFLAYCGGEAVGVCGMLPMTYEADGVLISTGLSNNIGLLRGHRGGTLMSDLEVNAEVEFGADAYIGVSNSMALKGHLRAGWKHVHDIGLLEGTVPLDRFSGWWMDAWGSQHVRDDAWRAWRYSKPGECYKTLGGMVYKVHDDVNQVMESAEFREAGRFGPGSKVGLMVTPGSCAWYELKAARFKPRFMRHLVVNGALAACLPPRVEPADFDVL